MLSTVKRQRHVLLRKILHLDNLGRRVAVVLADGYDYIRTEQASRLGLNKPRLFCW